MTLATRDAACFDCQSVFIALIARIVVLVISAFVRFVAIYVFVFIYIAHFIPLYGGNLFCVQVYVKCHCLCKDRFREVLKFLKDLLALQIFL